MRACDFFFKPQNYGSGVSNSFHITSSKGLFAALVSLSAIPDFAKALLNGFF